MARGLPSANAALWQGETRIARLRVCRSPWEQLRGLIGFPRLPHGFGVALPGCAAVHTAFLRFPIDVLFLREDRIVGIARDLSPWRITHCRGAGVAVELAAGSARRLSLSVGDAAELRHD